MDRGHGASSHPPQPSPSTDLRPVPKGSEEVPGRPLGISGPALTRIPPHTPLPTHPHMYSTCTHTLFFFFLTIHGSVWRDPTLNTEEYAYKYLTDISTISLMHTTRHCCFSSQCLPPMNLPSAIWEIRLVTSVTLMRKKEKKRKKKHKKDIMIIM